MDYLEHKTHLDLINDRFFELVIEKERQQKKGVMDSKEMNLGMGLSEIIASALANTTWDPGRMVESQQEYYRSRKGEEKMARTKINYVKFVNKDGEESIKITEIKNVVNKHDLPESYLDAKPCYYFHFNEVKVFTESTMFRLETGKEYTNKEFQRIIVAMKVAGDRLAAINKEIAEKREKWSGTGEVEI